MAQPANTVIWIVTLTAGVYEARLFLVEKTGLDSTDVMLRADNLLGLQALGPRDVKRIPKFPTQGATVVENWI